MASSNEVDLNALDFDGDGEGLLGGKPDDLGLDEPAVEAKPKAKKKTPPAQMAFGALLVLGVGFLAYKKLSGPSMPPDVSYATPPVAAQPAPPSQSATGVIDPMSAPGAPGVIATQAAPAAQPQQQEAAVIAPAAAPAPAQPTQQAAPAIVTPTASAAVQPAATPAPAKAETKPAAVATATAASDEKLAATNHELQQAKDEIKSLKEELVGLRNLARAKHAPAQVASVRPKPAKRIAAAEHNAEAPARRASSAEVSAQPVTKEPPVSARASGYTIHAINSGTAWLRQAGTTDTVQVTEGTVIQGLGTIKRIDPVAGEVETSSGVVR